MSTRLRRCSPCRNLHKTRCAIHESSCGTERQRVRFRRPRGNEEGQSRRSRTRQTMDRKHSDHFGCGPSSSVRLHDGSRSTRT
ncbi:hypothetical protein OF83DRAFT_139555 [Amylostereum chailletii]|nr:hypothetical protein OF83DRAFT_139555 [Amylostereum chailletii]